MAIPFITIELDRPRKLRMGLGAMVEFEQVTGMKLTELDDDMSITVLAKLLWIMLKQDDAELTFEDCLKLVDDNSSNIQKLMEDVTKAITVAFDTGESKNAKPTARKS